MTGIAEASVIGVQGKAAISFLSTMLLKVADGAGTTIGKGIIGAITGLLILSAVLVVKDLKADTLEQANKAAEAMVTKSHKEITAKIDNMETEQKTRDANYRQDQQATKKSIDDLTKIIIENMRTN